MYNYKYTKLQGLILMVTNNEYNILLAIWKAGRPLSAKEIVASIEDKTFKDRSVHSLLNAMLEKGLVYVDGQRLSSRIYSRLFNTSLSFEQFQSQQITSNPIYRSSKAKVLPGIFSALMDDEDISSDTLDQLEALLAERKKNLHHGSDGI